MASESTTVWNLLVVRMGFKEAIYISGLGHMEFTYSTNQQMMRVQMQVEVMVVEGLIVGRGMCQGDVSVWWELEPCLFI